MTDALSGVYPHTFRLGDVVHLSCDEDTLMTISHLVENSTLVDCMWFDLEGHLQKASFRAAVLVKNKVQGA